MKHALALKANSFHNNNNGSITVMFVFMMLGIFMMVGAAVDFGRAYNAKSDLQNSLDAALLAAARESLKDNGDIQAVADAFVKSNWQNEYGGKDFPTVKVSSPEAGIVTGTISYVVPTSFLRLTGMKKLKVGANGTVNMGLGRVEIAMALDITDSMEGSKLASLKDSANLLIDALMPDGEVLTITSISASFRLAAMSMLELEYRDESMDRRACR